MLFPIEKAAKCGKDCDEQNKQDGLFGERHPVFGGETERGVPGHGPREKVVDDRGDELEVGARLSAEGGNGTHLQLPADCSQRQAKRIEPNGPKRPLLIELPKRQSSPTN
jgi:hypothetical protein